MAAVWLLSAQCTLLKWPGLQTLYDNAGVTYCMKSLNSSDKYTCHYVCRWSEAGLKGRKAGGMRQDEGRKNEGIFF